MPNYTSQKPVEEIKSLIDQLIEVCSSLDDEELKGKLLPAIESIKGLLPQDQPEQGMEEADNMMKNKEGGGFMEKLMGGPAVTEPNTP